MQRIHGLYVANKRLPANDYRVLYPTRSKFCTVSYALPGKPENIAAQDYLAVGFGEGFRPTEFIHLFRLWAYLRKNKNKYHFVHFYATTLILFGPLAAHLAGVPCILTLTGFGRTFSSPAMKNKILRPVYHLLLTISIHLSRAVLFQNQADMKKLSERYPRERDKFFYAGSGVEYPTVQNKAFDAPRLRVLLVARLLPDKGIEDFLTTAERLHAGGVFEFVLVGPVSVGYNSLLEQVRSRAGRGEIRYLGELDAGALFTQYESAHILFFPSYLEGLSRVMLEAGFALLCPVAYDIPANRDWLPAAAALTAVRDVDAAVEILEQLAADREGLEMNARAYQANIVKNYNLDAYSQRLDDILRGLDLGQRFAGGYAF